MEPEVYREMAAVQDRHWWFAARRRIVAALVAGLALGRAGQRPRILEIGCGPGGNLAMLAAFGELAAMEYDAEAAALAGAKNICPVAEGGLPEPVPYADESFDLICLFDVLEHIEDDRAALARVARLLVPGGRVVLTVPAYAWLWSSHDTAHHHLRRYTAAMLRAAAESAGFSVARVGYFNALLFPLIAGVRLLNKLTGRDGGSDAALPSPAVNGLLTSVFGLERFVVPRAFFPFGTSVVAVLERR